MRLDGGIHALVFNDRVPLVFPALIQPEPAPLQLRYVAILPGPHVLRVQQKPLSILWACSIAALLGAGQPNITWVATLEILKEGETTNHTAWLWKGGACLPKISGIRQS